jgi:acyl-CoA reductase-like NAD-dependent aldehyde dehydrogenase
VPVSEAPVDVIPQPALLIGDQRVTDASGGTFEHVYPATGKPTRTIPLAGREEIDRAVAAARGALPAWRATPADARRDCMLRLANLITQHAPELTQLNIVDNGTPAAIAGFAPAAAADLFTYNAGWMDKIGGDVVTTWPIPAFDYAVEEPYGVVGVIIPWNGPVHAIGMTLGPVLAAGNCTILKPPELAPFAALRMGELFLEAGFPPGVVNIVPGGPEAGEALVRHPGVDKVHFTGSGATAKKILASALETLKPVGLELGGKSARLVFADADLDAVTPEALSGIINLAGQGCINGTRILVQRPIYGELVERVAAMAGQIPVGDPIAADTVVGPVVNDTACQRILGVIQHAVDNDEGRLVAGGQRLGGDLADGYFLPLTVFADVDNATRLAQNEVFGPVLAMIPFDTEEEAIGIANDTTYGLAAYVHTEDLRRAHRVSAALEAGNVWVNSFLGIPAAAPFGGTKQSGYGRLGGLAGVKEFLRPKNVWMPL